MPFPISFEYSLKGIPIKASEAQEKIAFRLRELGAINIEKNECEIAFKNRIFGYVHSFNPILSISSARIELVIDGDAQLQVKYKVYLVHTNLFVLLFVPVLAFWLPSNYSLLFRSAITMIVPLLFLAVLYVNSMIDFRSIIKKALDT